MTLSRIAFKFIRLVVKRISSRGMKKVNSYDLYLGVIFVVRALKTATTARMMRCNQINV